MRGLSISGVETVAGAEAEKEERHESLLGRMALHQLLDKIGELDEKQILVLGFRQVKYFNLGSVSVFL